MIARIAKERTTNVVLLDTDTITILEREGPEAVQLRSRLATVPLDDIATSVISYEEQTRGWLASMARLRTESARLHAYVFLKRHIEIYCRVAIVQYDAKAAADFERLRQAKIRIGTMDMKIAAIALANDALLVSRNLSDFAKVAGLKVEDWSIS
jgi:tRNA(fMet)-specific endonuclease VapC